MRSPGEIEQQINELIGFLVSVSLCDLQFFAFQKRREGNVIEVTFKEAMHISAALKNRPYGAVYDHFVKENAYNVKMFDGSLIQMMYMFDQRELLRHRLAFFPAPSSKEFPITPEFNEIEGIYAARVAASNVPFPLRFDYDASNDRHQSVVHAKSHLTLGQYENCRIPVTKPMTPGRFIDFILRNFYDTPARRYADELPNDRRSFAESIVPEERNVVHIAIPA